MRAVLDRPKGFGLVLKSTYCHFAKSCVKVLDSEAPRDGIGAESGKMEAVLNFPKPLKLKRSRLFLRLCSCYRRFIRHFSHVAGQFHRLSKEDVMFAWNSVKELAFEAPQKAMTTAPVLEHFDAKRPAEVHPNASSCAIKVVILQRDGYNQERVVTYGSAV